MLPGSPSAHTAPPRSSSVGADRARSAPELELGQHGAAELAELDRLGAQLDLGVDAAGRAGRRPAVRAGAPGRGRAPPARARPRGPGARRARSSPSSSSIPSSEASGVRSSCEAVATNARRASSCWRSRCCMWQRAREVADLVACAVDRDLDDRPASAELRAASRSRRRRRTSRAESGMPEQERRARARPARRRRTRAGRRATASGISPIGLAHREDVAAGRRTSTNGIAARAYSVPSTSRTCTGVPLVSERRRDVVEGIVGVAIRVVASAHEPGSAPAAPGRRRRASSAARRPFWCTARSVRSARTRHAGRGPHDEGLERALAAQRRPSASSSRRCAGSARAGPAAPAPPRPAWPRR